MVTTKINIDLAKKTTAPVVYAMQNDSDSRVVEAHLFVNGLPFDIGEASLSVLFQKPDGKGGWYDKLPDESNAIEAKDGNVVSAILAPQVLNVSGWVIAAIRVDFADGGILSTFPFKIFVEKDPSFGGVESNNYFNVSNWAEVNEEISSIKESLSKALVPDEIGNIDVNRASLRGVGALQINPSNDVIGVWLHVEVPEPSGGEGRPTGALSFYDASYDLPVILRNIADGERDSDATTVGQMNAALAEKNSVHAVGGLEFDTMAQNSELIIGDLYIITDDEGSVSKGEILEAGSESSASVKGRIWDGFSPTAEVEETAEGAMITITDKNGTTTATVKNGKDGTGGGTAEGAVLYYRTEREEIGVSHENINTDYIFSLYDALVEEYPDNIRKITIKSDDESFTNYVYEISTGEYCHSDNTVYGKQFSADEHIKKPKYLVLNAFHGSERKTVFSTYRFIRDVLKGHNVPQVFKEGATIQVLPVANPTGFNAFEYRKPNGVDINHNFDWNWEEGKSSGAYPASEPETQVITKWLNDNSDAELFIDFHNNGMVNENVAIIGTPSNDDAERAKKIALRGIDRVIPFWRDVIGYDSFVVPVMGETSITDEREEKDVIFAYSVSAEVGGSAFSYAQNVLGIPSFVMETSSYYGDYDEWKANETAYPAETIAMGAEALGNILIELFESCEVNNMTEVNEKLDTILQGVSFREVKGQLVVNATTGAAIIYADGTVDATTGDLIPVEGKPALRIKLPIPNGARIVCIKADAETEAAIKTTQIKYFVQATVDFSPIGYLMSENVFPHTLWEYNESTSKGNYARGVSKCYNTDGFNVAIARLKAGTYNWTAYYWND